MPAALPDMVNDCASPLLFDDGETVATLVLPLLALTYHLVGLPPKLNDIVPLLPLETLIEVHVLMYVASISGVGTVMLAVPLYPPSVDVAVIVALPTPFAVTVPLLTVATDVLLLTHDDMFWFEASPGLNEGDNVHVSPSLLR